MSALLKTTPSTSLTKIERTLLDGDSQLIVVAGRYVAFPDPDSVSVA